MTAGSGPPPEHHRPATGPAPVSAAERAAFEALVATSLPAVRASAQTWRNGLTALITLVAAGVVVQGPTSTTNLSLPWRTVIAALIGAGLAVAVAGLWQSMSAEAGNGSVTRTLGEIHARHASVAAFQVGLAHTAVRQLDRARVSVAVALTLLVAGIMVHWLAPRTATPPAYLRVVDQQGATTCGTVRSADGGLLRLGVAGAHEPTVVPLAGLRNMAVVAACP